MNTKQIEAEHESHQFFELRSHPFSCSSPKSSRGTGTVCLKHDSLKIDSLPVAAQHLARAVCFCEQPVPGMVAGSAVGHQEAMWKVKARASFFRSATSLACFSISMACISRRDANVARSEKSSLHPVAFVATF